MEVDRGLFLLPLSFEKYRRQAVISSSIDTLAVQLLGEKQRGGHAKTTCREEKYLSTRSHQKRFAIMRKIGMTAQEIKQSINSQMLTVFGMPLLVAGIHLVLTLDVVHRMMTYALMDDKPLIIRVMVVSFFLFAIVYFIVYILTSKAYFRIVNQQTGM